MPENTSIVVDLSVAEQLRSQIYNELEGSTVAAFKLEQSWVRLGVLLTEFKQKEYWREYVQYETYDDFISELKTHFNRGRTMLYGYQGAVEKLLPTISKEDLEKMGIAKAQELARAHKKLEGKPLPAGLLESAMDSSKTAKELRGDVGKALNIEPDQAGTWFDLDGIFMSAEDRKEFKEVWQATEGILGLTPNIPAHVRRKAVFNAWMQEWAGTWLPVFYGTKIEVGTATMPESNVI